MRILCFWWKVVKDAWKEAKEWSHLAHFLIVLASGALILASIHLHEYTMAVVLPLAVFLAVFLVAVFCRIPLAYLEEHEKRLALEKEFEARETMNREERKANEARLNEQFAAERENWRTERESLQAASADREQRRQQRLELNQLIMDGNQVVQRIRDEPGALNPTTGMELPSQDLEQCVNAWAARAQAWVAGNFPDFQGLYASDAGFASATALAGKHMRFTHLWHFIQNRLTRLQELLRRG